MAHKLGSLWYGVLATDSWQQDKWAYNSVRRSNFPRLFHSSDLNLKILNKMSQDSFKVCTTKHLLRKSQRSVLIGIFIMIIVSRSVLKTDHITSADREWYVYIKLTSKPRDILINKWHIKLYTPILHGLWVLADRPKFCWVLYNQSNFYQFWGNI